MKKVTVFTSICLYFLFSYINFILLPSLKSAIKIFIWYKRRYLIFKRNYYTPCAIIQFQTKSKKKISDP